MAIEVTDMTMLLPETSTGETVACSLLVEEAGMTTSPKLRSLSEAWSFSAEESRPARLEQLQSFRASILLALTSSRLKLVGVIMVWYFIGAIAIVTTKILLTEWQVSPLLLTFQQLFLGSTLLRIHLAFTGGVQPLRRDKDDEEPSFVDFTLTGLFNAMDFLASNTAFRMAEASFVETIKASDPISTTAVALIWKVDRLGRGESVSLLLLVAGMLFSTLGNASSSGDDAENAQVTPLTESMQSAVIVLIANLCFAFRAMTQKLYQQNASPEPINEENLLYRMQQIGWITLLLPVLLYYRNTMWYHDISMDDLLQYLKLCLVNAVCYATYNLASTYVLTKLSVVHHSTLGCLRRLFVIVVTCFFFGVPLTAAGSVGILTSFGGFCAFTHYRNVRQRNEDKKTSD